MTGFDVVLKGAWLLPVSGPPQKEGWLAFEDGRIAALGTGPSPSAARHLSWEKGVILPGLVNAHSHLGCSFLEGRARDAGFVDWLDGDITPRVMAAYLGPRAEEQQDDLRGHALRAARMMAASGVTTLVDSFFSAMALSVMEETSFRGFFCREYFGSRADDLSAFIAEAQARMDEDAARDLPPLMGMGLAPHALYSCPRDVLVALVDKARALSWPVTIHVAESREEHRFFCRSEGVMRELFAPDEAALSRYELGRSPVAVLHELGLLAPDILLVHMVQASDEDLDLVAASGAGVVHCPGSNATLAVGAAPVARMLERGIPVALGTDSLASNTSMDLWDEMNLALMSHRISTGRIEPLDCARVLRMATMDGARVCGLGDQVGRLEVGLRADVIVMEPAVHASCGDEVIPALLARGRRLCARFLEGRDVTGVAGGGSGRP